MNLMIEEEWKEDMKYGFLAAFAIISSTNFSAPAISAELPREFVGIWTLASEANNACKKQDWKGPGGQSESDALQSIQSKKIDGWEHACDVTSVKLRSKDGSTVEVDMSCAGEGEVWKTTQLWYLQNVGGRNQLVSYEIKRSEGDQKSKPTYTMSIQLECK
jgi:hypothetical protein